MNKNTLLACGALAAAFLATPRPAAAQFWMERLTRGVVAVNQGDGKVFVSWRLFLTDDPETAFNLYRKTGTEAPVKLNDEPLTAATCFQDEGVDLAQANEWFVRPVVDGEEQAPSKAYPLPADSPVQSYIAIPLVPEVGIPNDCSAADLDGDGEYEIIVKRENGARDNSQDGRTGPTFLEAYEMDGTRMWSINLGINIRGGAHYTQFMVYDFDGDGKAEMFVKTADGTVDGAGTVIGDPEADYRNRDGYILAGPEFLTVFDGETGAALDTVPFEPARGNVADWGDNYGNRVDRFVSAVAYLDGERPSAIMARGYYTGRGENGLRGRNEIAAYNLVDGKIVPVWHFRANAGNGADINTEYLGQGNHGTSVADVDDDGRQEIVYGAMTVDDDGSGLYSTRLGHGDALHVGDLDPARPGLEVWAIHENPRRFGTTFRDARTGEIIFGDDERTDIGRGLAADVDPRHRGAELFGSRSGAKNTDGEVVEVRGGNNFAIWWDGDLQREILNSNHIEKWDWENGEMKRIFEAEGCRSNNGTKSTPALSADLFGDWREEVMFRTADNSELRIYTTTHPTEHRMYTLMHDPQYRVAIAWQNTSYNQPPWPGFYVGSEMEPPPRPEIQLRPEVEGD